MNATKTRQDAPQTTMVKSMTCQTYTLTNDSTGHAAKITIVQHHDQIVATVEAYSATDTREQAERFGLLASATLPMLEGDSIHSYTRRVAREAAILGMDTLRELARPVYSEPSTAGEA